MADLSPLLIWSTDRGARLDYVNAAFRDFFGLAAGDPIQAFDWRAVLHPDDAPWYLSAFDEAFPAGRIFVARARMRRADGAMRWIESHANPHRDPDGRVIGMVGSSLDVSELIEAQTVLQDADRRKDEFLATLAHELRNPLGPICNRLELLQSPDVDGATAAQLHRILDRQAKMLVRLVDDLLEVSRVTHGTIQLQKGRTTITSVIQEALDVSRGSITADRHVLEVRLPGEPLEVWADRTRLVQVIANLLINAAKYTAAGGRIVLAVERRQNDVITSVADNGMGIEPQRLTSIFDFFARGAMPPGKVQSGLGVGLALSRRIVDLHGGQISADSDGPGKGSTFVVRLPLFQRPPVTVTPAPRARQALPRRSPRNGPTP